MNLSHTFNRSVFGFYASSHCISIWQSDRVKQFSLYLNPQSRSNFQKHFFQPFYRSIMTEIEETFIFRLKINRIQRYDDINAKIVI